MIWQNWEQWAWQIGALLFLCSVLLTDRLQSTTKKAHWSISSSTTVRTPCPLFLGHKKKITADCGVGSTCLVLHRWNCRLVSNMSLLCHILNNLLAFPTHFCLVYGLLWKQNWISLCSWPDESYPPKRCLHFLNLLTGRTDTREFHTLQRENKTGTTGNGKTFNSLFFCSWMPCFSPSWTEMKNRAGAND